MKPFAELFVPLALLTATVTTPAECGPVLQVNVVAEATLTPVQFTLPIETVVPSINPLPVKVTAVEPAVDPVLGATRVTTGAGAT